jgi:PAS domain S-box-containing protein
MEKPFRKTGIDIIGDAPWGTHLCQFYETREDLVDILIPYFKAGLENNEFCMWITSEPLKIEDAKAALKKVVKNLDHFIKKGQIEILDYSEWYTKSGKFDANNVLQGWVEKENQALKRGYDGLRLSGNTFWLEKRDWRNFTNYEEEINKVIGKYRMISICTYSLGKCGASEVIDVVSNHQFALIRQEGKWVIVESSERKQAEAALRVSHRFLEIVNRHTGMDPLLNEFVVEVQKITQCAAVGIRILDEEGNIPYQAYKGFSQRFYESESPLSIKSDQCMCINVVKGVTDPKVPFYTEGGSFYMNGTTRFLATVSEEEKGQTRNVCNQVGYESVALVPIRLGDRILGLIHVADPQENMVRLDKVEILERAATQLGTAIQRLKTEEALRESEENFKTLAENAIDGILIAMGEGATVYANKRTAEIMGYSVAELLKTSIKDLAHPDEFEKIMERYRERLEAKPVPSQYETILVRKDGKSVPIELAATKTAWQGQPADLVFLRDITDRKRAEEALRESEEKYRTLFEESRDAIYINSQKGEILDVNQSFLDLFGYTREEILKLNVQKTYINLADRDSFQEEIEQKGYVKNFEVKLCKKGGTEMVCLLTSTVKQAPDKSILGYQGIIRDITERKRAEEERTRLMAELEAKNREMEAYVYTVSHDLKAPLVSLNGFSGALRKEYESQLGEEGRHYLERIQANVAHMEALTTSLLELSRIGRVVGSIEEIDVAALLREIRNALAVRLKEAGAEFVVQEPLPTVCADRGRIYQVFANLIDNAVKFRSAERALRIEVGCRQESGFFRFHMADNGIGIAPQFHEQIFTPFRKMHPEVEGVGIGLALVKKIVEHHGGRAWVESEAGKGSTFYFTLPMKGESK